MNWSKDAETWVLLIIVCPFIIGAFLFLGWMYPHLGMDVEPPTWIYYSAGIGVGWLILCMLAVMFLLLRLEPRNYWWRLTIGIFLIADMFWPRNLALFYLQIIRGLELMFAINAFIPPTKEEGKSASSPG